MVTKKIFHLKRSLWLIPLGLITIHAFLMNGYYYSHRQLTTGSYLSQIFAYGDPSLFKNSIYVQAVNRTNLRISLFYNLCPFILKNFDFEVFALIQSIISLFFVLSGIFFLTKTIFNNTLAGYISTLLYTAELNNWTLGSPSPYLNFFHHGLPYTYPLIIWSLGFFFQKRLLLSAFLAGIAWDFHPMTTLFLLFFYLLYLCFNRREFKLTTILLSTAILILSSLPVLIKSLLHMRGGSASGPLWLKGVLWVAGYTCFPFSWSFEAYIRAGMFFILFICSLLFIPRNRIQAIILIICSVGVLCTIGTIFSEIYPIPFIIKLSLWRSTVIYLVIAISCIGFALSHLFNTQLFTKRFLAICILILVTGYFRSLTNYYLSYLPLFLGLFLYFRFEKGIKTHLQSFSKSYFIFISLCLCLILLAHFLTSPKDALKLSAFFFFITIFLLGLRCIENRFTSKLKIPSIWLLVITFFIIFDTASLYVRGGPKIYFRGKFQGRPDPWAEIQHFAKLHSDKDDLFIVPPWLNDFTTYSQRAILGDWAEGSTLLYLDNQFTQEWFARMTDLGCKPNHWFEEYNYLKTEEILRVAAKYNAKFIVTEKPKTFKLKKLYENSQFILYQALPENLSCL